MRLQNNNVYFVVEDIYPNEFISDIRNINIEIIYKKEKVIYKTSFDNYKKIKKYYPYLKFHIVRYEGFLLLKLLLKKYYLAFIFLIVSIFIVFFLSFLIVDIKIETSDKNLYNIVNNALKEENIKPFIIRKSYKDINKIKESIKNKNKNDIDWLEIKRVGMKYIVNVEKRIIKDVEKSLSYCNIYAKKDGMVKRIKTYQGIGLVSMNDYVSKGDLLISGDIIVNDKIVNQVCASGVVYAESWYIVNIKVPLNYYEYVHTGKKRNNIIIKTGDSVFQLFKNRIDSYDSSEKQIWEILGTKIYLRKDYEIKKIPKKFSEEEAIAKALEEASKKIKLKLDDDEKIINQKILQKQVIDSKMNIEIFIITEEKIGYSNIK